MEFLRAAPPAALVKTFHWNASEGRRPSGASLPNQKPHGRSSQRPIRAGLAPHYNGRLSRVTVKDRFICCDSARLHVTCESRPLYSHVIQFVCPHRARIANRTRLPPRFAEGGSHGQSFPVRGPFETGQTHAQSSRRLSVATRSERERARIHPCREAHPSNIFPPSPGEGWRASARVRGQL